MAGSQGRHQTSEIRELIFFQTIFLQIFEKKFFDVFLNWKIITNFGTHLGEENVDPSGHFVQGFPGRVLDVLELLPWFEIWGGARLHVPASVVPHFVPHAEPHLWLRLRLDHVETEVTEEPRVHIARQKTWRQGREIEDRLTRAYMQ